MPYIKLLKLLYLADRKALIEMGRPISYDRFYSLPQGPVLSRTYDLIVSEPNPNTPSYWREFISAPEGYSVGLIREPESDQLSPAEEAVLDSVFEEFGQLGKWELVEYTHGLPEYEDPHGSSIPIRVDTILLSAGASDEDVRSIMAALWSEAVIEEFAF